MSKTTLVWFLIAGLVGAIGAYDTTAGPRWYGRSLAWAIVALFAFLGLVGVLAV